MNEELNIITPEELARHLAVARRLQSQELARLSGRLFRAPIALLRRIAHRGTAAAPVTASSAPQA